MGVKDPKGSCKDKTEEADTALCLETEYKKLKEEFDKKQNCKCDEEKCVLKTTPDSNEDSPPETCDKKKCEKESEKKCEEANEKVNEDENCKDEEKNEKEKCLKKKYTDLVKNLSIDDNCECKEIKEKCDLTPTPDSNEDSPPKTCDNEKCKDEEEDEKQKCLTIKYTELVKGLRINDECKCEEKEKVTCKLTAESGSNVILIISIVAVVLVVLGAGFYVYRRNAGNGN